MYSGQIRVTHAGPQGTALCNMFVSDKGEGFPVGI